MHLTLDMAGATKFGPDVEWVGGEEYAVDPARAASFYPAIRTYFPGLPDGALAPAYSGARQAIPPTEAVVLLLLRLTGDVKTVKAAGVPHFCWTEQKLHPCRVCMLPCSS